MIDPLKHRFAALYSCVEFHSLHYVQRNGEYLSVRRNASEPPHFGQDRGAMLYVRLNGVEAHAAINDLPTTGPQAVLEQTERQAERVARRTLFDARGLPSVSGHSQYRSPNQDAPSPSLVGRYELLAEGSAKMSRGEHPVNWGVSLEVSRQEQLYLNSAGAEQYREQHFVYPGISVITYNDYDSQTRNFGDHHAGQRGDVEVIECLSLADTAPRIADQAPQLPVASNTPSGRCDLLLMPDQVIPQIHESVDHPLELSRTPDDERSYVGASLVKTEDLGRHQYSSSPPNISFDPKIPEELTSYRQDDNGSPARKEYLVCEDHLLHPLGGALSQHRSGLGGVANSRVSSWSHVPIDRMTNLNLGPGDKSLTQLVGDIGRGMLMSYNRSWSIDDARNEFQLGYEWGQLIEGGELKGVVRNPNHQGISAQFWCNLSAMGGTGTFEVLNTPYCGKGEPNRVIHVGHASPAYVSSDVDVFGGDI